MTFLVQRILYDRDRNEVNLVKFASFLDEVA